MKCEVLKCDQCEKESKDIIGDDGWINLRSPGDIEFTVNQYGNTAVRHKYIKPVTIGNLTLAEVDFCSVECMLKWIGIVNDEKYVCKKCDKIVERVIACLPGMGDVCVDCYTEIRMKDR